MIKEILIPRRLQLQSLVDFGVFIYIKEIILYPLIGKDHG